MEAEKIVIASLIGAGLCGNLTIIIWDAKYDRRPVRISRIIMGLAIGLFIPPLASLFQLFIAPLWR